MVDPIQPVLEVTDLVKHFPAGSGLRAPREVVRAVDGVSLRINPGEVVGLVGESGSGKSTVARCIARLIEPTSGRIVLAGRDITHLSRRQMRPLRETVRIVFQDPYSSLDPRMTAGRIVGEPLRIRGVASGRQLDRRVAALFEKVGMATGFRHRYPHELSGGQRQRVGLARALSLEPRLLIADEPVSALDVSVQAAMINLLMDLQRDMGFSCLFITHDLSAVEFISNRIVVMYLGKIVEAAPREELFATPKHPYTQALLSAALVPDPVRQRSRRRVILAGDIPSPIDPPSGCVFHTRCPVAVERCAQEVPALDEVPGPDRGSGHLAACHLIGPDGAAPVVVAAYDER
jgi:oligopeptide/dipeptide ABC transporter ATP-binding protein